MSVDRASVDASVTLLDLLDDHRALNLQVVIAVAGDGFFGRLINLYPI